MTAATAVSTDVELRGELPPDAWRCMSSGLFSSSCAGRKNHCQFGHTGSLARTTRQHPQSISIPYLDSVQRRAKQRLDLQAG